MLPARRGPYSYADKSTNAALGRSIISGRTYLVVETESSMTQLRDNGRVVWYVVHHVRKVLRKSRLSRWKTSQAALRRR